MKTLLHKLEYFGIKPYYLFQCDLIEGTEHFRTKVNEGLDIIKKLINNTGGLCIPLFVIDVPEIGKIPLMPEYIIKKSEKDLFIQNENILIRYSLEI